MKKIIYSAIAMAFAFFAASCQQEKFEPVATGNTVTYTVKVADALATKAIGDETTTVDKVYYQVYREAEVGNLTKVFVYEGEADVNAGTASFDLEFVKNQKFVVLFWAQDEDLQMFNIEDLRKVQLTTPGASNNVNAQVFAGSDTVTDCVSGKGGNVELTRPISQLNIFTTKESLKYGDKTIDLVSSTVTVKGPKGELTQAVDSRITVKNEGNTILVERHSENKEDKSLHGLYRALINNMVVGVTAGYEKKLEIVGVGYRVALQGKNLNIGLGYSHPVIVEPVDGITFEAPDATTIIVKGIDKQLVGETAAVIRGKRPAILRSGILCQFLNNPLTVCLKVINKDIHTDCGW